MDRAANLIPPVQAALENLTGQKFPDGANWEAWWTKNRPSFTIKKD